MAPAACLQRAQVGGRAVQINERNPINLAALANPRGKPNGVGQMCVSVGTPEAEDWRDPSPARAPPAGPARLAGLSACPHLWEWPREPQLQGSVAEARGNRTADLACAPAEGTGPLSPRRRVPWGTIPGWDARL